MIDLIGYVAAICTTIAFAPQLAKAWRTRSTSDISLGMFSLLVIGIVLWLVYGVLIASLPIILANAVTACLASVILGMKIFNTVALSRAMRAKTS